MSAGAALGATIAIVWKPLGRSASTRCPCWPSWAARLAAFLVYRVATFSGRTGSASLLLSGVAVGSTLTAIMSFLMVATERDLHTVVVWLMGGLTTATWTKVYITLPVVAAGFVYMMLMSRRMNLLLMGEERARELGVDSQRTRRNLMIVASLTTAAAVAFTGLIGFVGLMVPHIMRLLVGPDHRRLLPASALFGALLLLLADTVARTVLAPAEIPVGIITAAAGGPFFLYLLAHAQGGLRVAVAQPVFDVRALEVALGGQRVLGPLDLEVARGSFVGILGPNGSGKTTLSARPHGSGQADGRHGLAGGPPAGRLPRDRARPPGGRRPPAVQPRLQLHGRGDGEPWAATPTRGTRSAAGKMLAARDEAEASVDMALAQTGLTDLAGRLVTELSGGERQRALIAQTLAQQTPILLLDEPLNNLDLNHQLEIMQLLAGSTPRAGPSSWCCTTSTWPLSTAKSWSC